LAVHKFQLNKAMTQSKLNYFLVGFLFMLIFVLESSGNIQTPMFMQIYGSNSPSFVRQEIIDDPDDWIFWKGNSSTAMLNTSDGRLVEIDKANKSECKITYNFIPPDIRSVSYISDGKILNASVWLSSPFKEPPLNDTVDIFQEDLRITISKTNLSLKEYVDRNRVNISHVIHPLFGIEENSTVIAGKEAHKILYTDKRNGLRVMQFWTIDSHKAFNVTYSAMPSEYDDYYARNIRHMIDTFEIGTLHNEKSPQKQSKINFLKFEDHGIRIEYPAHWKKQENENAESTIITFRSPFDDKREPSYHETTFTMAIDVDSVHDEGTDYRIIYSRVPNDSWTGNWSRQLQEISAHESIKVLEEHRIYPNFNDREEPYIPFSFNLDKVNSPQQYKVVFYITDYFVIGHRFCRLVDTTNWVIVPPPNFVMSASPSSVVMRPGEENNILVEIKGIANLQSEATLSIDNSRKDLLTTLIPNRTSIPSSSSGTSNLHIKVFDNTTVGTPTPVILPLRAIITFPTAITNRGGDTFSNNRSINLPESSNFTLTIMPHYTPAEQLNNFVNTWITPASGIWTFLAGIGAVVAPLFVHFYRKKQKPRRPSNKEEGDNATRHN
jgi:hypothetical protein